MRFNFPCLSHSHTFSGEHGPVRDPYPGDNFSGKGETAAPGLARAFSLDLESLLSYCLRWTSSGPPNTPRLETTPGVETGAPRYRSMEPVRIVGHPIRRRSLCRHCGAPQRNPAEVHDTGLPQNPALFRNHCAKSGNGSVHFTAGNRCLLFMVSFPVRIGGAGFRNRTSCAGPSMPWPVDQG